MPHTALKGPIVGCLENRKDLRTSAITQNLYLNKAQIAGCEDEAILNLAAARIILTDPIYVMDRTYIIDLPIKSQV